jgi:PIN domain nuclease of toxin-antitoxin system
LSHLVRKGRLKLKEDFPASLDRMLTGIPVHEAPFNFAVASQACRVDLPQGDPGDIFLAATAVFLGLTLVTADSQLIGCQWLETMAND